MTAIRQGRVRVQAAHSAARSRRHCARAEPPGRPTLARSRTCAHGRVAPPPSPGRPPRAAAATLPARSRLAGGVAGLLALVAADGGALLGVNPLDVRASPPAVRRPARLLTI